MQESSANCITKLYEKEERVKPITMCGLFCHRKTVSVQFYREWQEFPEAFFMAGSVNRTEGEGALLPRHVECILV